MANVKFQYYGLVVSVDAIVTHNPNANSGHPDHRFDEPELNLEITNIDVCDIIGTEFGRAILSAFEHQRELDEEAKAENLIHTAECSPTLH